MRQLPRPNPAYIQQTFPQKNGVPFPSLQLIPGHCTAITYILFSKDRQTKQISIFTPVFIDPGPCHQRMSHNALLIPLSLLLALAVGQVPARVVAPAAGDDAEFGQQISGSPWAGGQLLQNYGGNEGEMNYLQSALARFQNQQAQMPAAPMGQFGEGIEAADAEMPAMSSEEADENAELSFTLQLPAHIGQTAGLALDPQGRLVLFHRSARVWDEFSFDEKNRLNSSLAAIPNATLALVDSQSGKLLEEHGAGQFFMPHGLTVDGQGNLWLTDVGSHQVHKLDSSFKTVMSVGERLVPGSDDKHFCKPTDVAVASSGEFFVADGYCNSRVMKFDREGKLLSKFGHPDSSESPKAGEFFVPHSLALIEDLNLLCVADRENERIQCFSAGLEGSQHQHRRAYVPTGTFFTKAENIGRVYAIREKEHFLVGVTDRDRSGQLEPQVFVMDMNTGRANSFAKGLENAHAVALGTNGDIYVSQMEPAQIVKFGMGANNNEQREQQELGAN